MCNSVALRHVHHGTTVQVHIRCTHFDLRKFLRQHVHGACVNAAVNNQATACRASLSCVGNDASGDDGHSAVEVCIGKHHMG